MPRVLFCNWEVESKDLDQCTLFQLPDLTSYDFIFFDPLNFAIENKLKQEQSDLWAKEYISYSEFEFARYLERTKDIAAILSKFIENGGVWVIRCVLPNSYIKVRRKRSAGSGDYTITVISPFYWLERFLGKYSFQYGTRNRLRFIDQRNPLCGVFRNASADCVQTQNAILKGDVEMIADNGGASHLATISKVSYSSNRGEIFLIPKFLVDDETNKLIDAFSEYLQSRETQEYKPNWIDRWDQELELVNPYTEIIRETDLEIKKLKQARAVLLEKQEDIRSFTGLLYKVDEELRHVIENAFRLLGFHFPEPPLAMAKAGFHMYLKDKFAPHIVAIVGCADKGPLSLLKYEELKNKIASCNLLDKPKAILIANVDFDKSPDERLLWFGDDILEENRTEEFCLITTMHLFEVVRYLLSKSESPILDTIKQSLRKDIINCIDTYEINRTKYLAGV